MKRMQWEIHINAPQEEVFRIMLVPDNFKKWAEPFMPGSYVEGDWQEGSEIRFLVDGEDGKPSGMFSRIAERRDPEFISIEHVGIVVEGKVITEGEEVESMTPAFENYTLTKDGDGTRFLVDQDVAPQYEEVFNEAWPKALQKLKEICEN